MMINEIISLIQELNEEMHRLKVEIFGFNKEKTKILSYLKQSNILPHLPGGAVDPGESIIEAAKRELMEESGYLATDYKHINIPGNWKLNISTEDQLIYFPKWKVNKNFKSETYICVFCTILGFNPNTQYGIEKDNYEFTLNDINLIHKLTKTSVSKDKRIEFQKQFRLACFKQLGF